MYLDRCGHDGNPPVTEAVRDIEGEGKREITRLHRYDTIGWLFKRKLIDSHHEEAARLLQVAAENASIWSGAASGTGSSSGQAFTLSDGKLDALDRHASARADLRAFFGAVGDEAMRLVTLVVIDGHTLTETATIMSLNPRAVLFGLRLTLGFLARYYGLA